MIYVFIGDKPTNHHILHIQVQLLIQNDVTVYIKQSGPLCF